MGRPDVDIEPPRVVALVLRLAAIAEATPPAPVAPRLTLHHRPRPGR